MSIINKPSVNRGIQPNTSFLQASMNTVNNAVNNMLPKNIANTVNNATAPISGRYCTLFLAISAKIVLSKTHPHKKYKNLFLWRF